MDRKIASDIIDRFAKAARRQCDLDVEDTGYSFTSGYFQQAYLNLLEKVSADVCFSELQMLETATKRYEKQIVAKSLEAE